MKPTRSHWLVLALRVGLGVVLLYAGISKLENAEVFAAQIARLQLVPFRWAEWTAAILPVAECLTGAWLVSGWRPCAAALAAMLLMTVFVFAVGQAILRGIEFECACFGATASPPSPGWVLIRAMMLLAAAWIVRRNARASWEATERPRD